MNAPVQQVPPNTTVETYDVKAVNKKGQRSYFAGREKIYAKLAHGTFRRLKWILLVVTLALYYLVPWLRWDRGPELPSQAVLFDVANERFYIWGLEIWPQEFYLLTGLLVLSALVLFLATAVAGRVWCGYFCPQTVWTDLMISVERFWQGDRNARMKLDKAPWSLSKLGKKTATHVTWLLIAAATGGAFVFYFADAPTLFVELFTGQAPVEAYVFVALFTGTTYLLGGIAREQVCIYMCPWPRIQGAMVDHDTYLVSYRDARGEPRGSHKASDSWENRGDCVDCKACVAVCPMGIDIRDGSQLECIQCALCIDACNEIMEKVGRPRNLIAYDTIANEEAMRENKTAKPKLVRPRTAIYAGLIAIAAGLMVYGLSQRSILEANVMADRNPFYVRLSNGDIRNGFTMKILNKLHSARQYEIGVEGLPGASVRVARHKDGDTTVNVPVNDIKEEKIFVVVPKDVAPKLDAHGHAFNFLVRDVESGHLVRRASTFRRP
jgi:cytochrome c oxidase accessory protein FixG